MSNREQVDIVATSEMAKLFADQKKVAEGFHAWGDAAGIAEPKVRSLLDFTGAGALKLAAQVLGIGSAMQTVATAGRLIQAEYENFLERNRRQADAQVPFADSMRKVGQALGADVGQLDNFRSKILALSKSTGVSPTASAEGFAETLGAGNELGANATWQAIETAARFRPGQATGSQTLHAIARGILGMRATWKGTTNEQAMAGMQSFMAADPTVDIEKFVQHMLPGVLANANMGDSFHYLGGLFAGMGQGAYDWHGRTTRNNMTNFLVKQIYARTAGHVPDNATYEERDKFLFGTPQGGVIRRGMRGKYGAGDIDALSNDQVARQHLAATLGQDVMTAEAKHLIPFLEYLEGGDNATRRKIAAASKTILPLDDPRAIQRANKVEETIRASKSQTTAEVDRVLSGASDTGLLSEDGVVKRDKLKEYLNDLHVDAIRNRTIMAGFDVETAHADTPGERIGALRGALKRGRSGATGTSQFGKYLGFRDASPEQVQGVDELIQRLDKLIELEEKKQANPQSIKVQTENGPVRGSIGAERAGQ